MSASRLGGFHGVYDPRGVSADIGREASPVHMSPFGAYPESVCCFSRDGVEGVFWGELYDYPPSNTAPSIADRLLTGYSAHGADFAGQLDGIFALALWDKRAQRLLLFRDSSAARSLYYYQDSQGRIHFSTQLGYLVQQTRPSLCRKGLWEYLRFLEVAPPNTLYEGLYGLEAGYRLIAHADGMDVHPVLPAYGLIPSVADFEDAVSQLDVMLQDAVKTRMAGSGSVGAFLSGGVDSALICALANFVDKGRVHAVTVGFHDTSYDESIVAGRIAAHLGIEHEVIRFERSDYLNAMERLYASSEQPTADPAGLSTLMAFEHCQGRFDTMLDGSGAEALVGMMPARHTRLAIQYATLLPRGLRLGLAPLASRIPILRDYHALYDFDEPEELLIRWHGFTRHEIEKLCDERVSFTQTRFYQVFRSFSRSAHFERYSALLGAMTDDRICHAVSLTGVSARFPFIDRRIEGFVHSLPLYMRFAEGQEKRILREILARYVPRQIWDAPKHGFDFPFQAFLAADNYALARMYIESDASPLVKLFKQDCMRLYLKRFIAGDTSLAFKIWTFVVLAIWLDGHKAV